MKTTGSQVLALLRLRQVRLEGGFLPFAETRSGDKVAP
jgi:hypothetical protein